jgi:Ca2+-binding EF-hand superfamily protein
LELTAVFENFDVNNSGGIDKAEFAKGCTSLGLELSQEEVDLMW